MKISIVLLTWNSEQFVENCINSIYNSINIGDFEIIVVDNGSGDRTLEILEACFPRVRIIRNSSNMGVAHARNQGLKAAKGEYILMLDIDTVVKESAIDRLIDFIKANPRVGICGPKLVFPDGIVQKSCRRFPLLHTKLLRRINTKWAGEILKSEYYDFDLNGGKAFEVDYIIGACQLIRRKAFDEAGYLDDNIFYGPEDVDFCLRMWLKGWKVMYVPEVVVVHFEQRITRKKLFSYITFRHVEGLIYYFIKHRYCFSRKGLYKRIGM